MAPSRSASADRQALRCERSYALTVRPPAQILARRTVKPIAKGESLTLSSDHVRRSRARHRRGLDLGRLVGGVRCGEPARRARPLSVPLLGADHEPGAAAPLCQRSRQGGAYRARSGDRSADSRRHRGAADAAGFQRLVRSVGRRRRRCLAQLLCHRFLDPRARAQDSRCPIPRSSSRSTGCAMWSPTPPIRARTAAPISPMRSMCWRATAWRRSATCATSPMPSSMRCRRRSPRRKSPRRSPWSAIARGPNASTPRRWRRSRRQSQPDLVGREDYGSTLRDAAALVALASEGGAQRATVQAAVQRVEAARAILRPTSTQEDAWLLLAASAMAKDAGKVSLDVGGTPTPQRALPHHPRRRPEGAAAHRPIPARIRSRRW